jgi:hypothetical protein
MTNDERKFTAKQNRKWFQQSGSIEKVRRLSPEVVGNLVNR